MSSRACTSWCGSISIWLNIDPCQLKTKEWRSSSSFFPLVLNLYLHTNTKKMQGDLVSCYRGSSSSTWWPTCPRSHGVGETKNLETTLVYQSVGADISESRQWVTDSTHSANNHLWPVYNQSCPGNLITGFEWCRAEKGMRSITY